MRPLQEKKAMLLCRAVHFRPICSALVLHLEGKVKAKPSVSLIIDAAERRICGETGALRRRALAWGGGTAIILNWGMAEIRGRA